MAAKKKAENINAAAIGSSGLRASGGYVVEEFDPRLRGQKGNRIWREMGDNDPTCGAILFALRSLVSQVDFTFQAVDDTQEAEDYKAFAESVFDDMEASWSDVLESICSMFQFGYAPMELVWKIRSPETSKHDDGMIGLQCIDLRAQESINRWDMDPSTMELKGVWQQPISGAEVLIPIDRIALFRTTTMKNNPEGRSVLRNAYRPWFFKKRIEEIEAIGIERDLAGMPVMYLPAQYMSHDADDEDKQVLESYKVMLRSIRRDTHEGLILPSARDSSGNLAYELKLLSTAGSRQINTTTIVDRYDRRIATVVLADFLMLGQDAAGSFALSSDKTALFATALGGFLRRIADTINRVVMPQLWRFNGLPIATMPVLSAGDIEKPDLEKLSSFLTSLTGAGAQLFPDRELENHLRKMASLPPAPEEGSQVDYGDTGGDPADPEGAAQEDPEDGD